MIYRIPGTAHCSFTGKFRGHGIPRIKQFHKIISQDMLQQKMEGMAMVMMAQMAQLMKKHIVLQDTRKTYYIQIEIDVSLSGTAAPIRCVMLDSHPVI